jgi:hypothetical protein
LHPRRFFSYAAALRAFRARHRVARRASLSQFRGLNMRFFDFMRPILFLTAIGVAAGSLTSCNSTQTDPGVAQGVPAIPSTISPGALVGRWGVAAYHRDSDRPRTESEARRQCNNAYNIKAGPTGGVMMHLADESQPSELVLKGSPSGVTYLGVPGPAALPTDREIVTISDNSFTVKWVSPDNSTRYGTMVYIRCA